MRDFVGIDGGWGMGMIGSGGLTSELVLDVSRSGSEK